MTTIDTAAAWRVFRHFTLAVLAAGLGAGLAGCETGANLFGQSSDSASSNILATDTAAGQASGGTAKVTIAPVIGAPDNVAKLFETQLTSEIEKQNVTVAKLPDAKAEYTVRGYVVSARESSGTKLSYIWDVTDPEGKRVNRITGEELIQGGSGSDPWSAVTPQVIGGIANKTATSLATWLPSQATPTTVTDTTGQNAAAPAIAAAPGTRPPSALAIAPTASPPPATTTGSINKSEIVNAMVQPVIGAPGDGGVSLTGALQRELARNGVKLTDAPGGQTYRVEGKVAVGQSKDGKQPVQIDWNVKDPAGKKLGTVSQKKEIPQGSLDGPWGKTADAAAAAAAQGIVKLLPQPTQTN